MVSVYLSPERLQLISGYGCGFSTLTVHVLSLILLILKLILLKFSVGDELPLEMLPSYRALKKNSGSGLSALLCDWLFVSYVVVARKLLLRLTSPLEVLKPFSQALVNEVLRSAASAPSKLNFGGIWYVVAGL